MNLDADYHRMQVERAAQHILDIRARYAGATLAELYDPETMPADLRVAHEANDQAVDNAYIAAELRAGRKRPDLSSDAKRVAFLFELHQRLTTSGAPPAVQQGGLF
jgi:hypothetical protein